MEHVRRLTRARPKLSATYAYAVGEHTLKTVRHADPLASTSACAASAAFVRSAGSAVTRRRRGNRKTGSSASTR